MKIYLALIIFLRIEIYPQTISIPAIPFSPKSYVCYKAESLLLIDGRLDESSWRKAEWTDDFTDIEGTVKPKPRFRTRAKMLWDDRYIFVAAELEEPDIWGTLTERDAVIFYDNDFEVFIDPDGDTHQYYEFEMNAFNTVWDLFLDKPYRDGGSAINGWDIKGLKSGVLVEGRINQPGKNDKGWTLEIAFPWESLKECSHKDAPPKPGDQWRVNFSRVEWTVGVAGEKYQKAVNPNTGQPFPEDNWVWSPQGLINMHYPEMWGFVQFSDTIVGRGTDQFIFNPEENPKWALRQIYYREKQYYEKHRKYTVDLNELGLNEFKVEGYALPVVEITSNMFEAAITSLDGAARWHIAQDGRIWKR